MKKMLFRVIGTSTLATILPAFLLCSHGQGIQNKGAMIALTDSASLYIEGDFRNQPGSRIINSGRIILTGDWINNAESKLLRKNKGKVVFRKASHVIGGDSMTIFNDLSFPDSGSTLLKNDLVCQGVLVLKNHRIRLNGHRLHLENQERTALQSEEGRIISEFPQGSSFSWNMGSAPGLRIIPFGNDAGEAIPLYYDSRDSLTKTVSFSTYATNSNYEPLPVGKIKLHAPIDPVNTKKIKRAIKRFWIVESQEKTAPSYLKFTYSPEEGNNSYPEKLNVLSWVDSSGSWEPMPFFQAQEELPSCLASVNKSIFSVGSMGEESIQSSLSFTAFPVEENRVITRWFVVNLVADRYEVERSRDGLRFEKLDYPVSYQDRQTALNFELKDPSPFPGYSWYRVQQFQNDSSLGYSEKAKVYVSASEEIKVNFYPNPVYESAILQVHPGDINPDDISFELLDATGKIVLTKKLSDMNSKEKHLYEFHRGSLPPGFYAFRLFTNDRNVKTGKIILG